MQNRGIDRYRTPFRNIFLLILGWATGMFMFPAGASAYVQVLDTRANLTVERAEVTLRDIVTDHTRLPEAWHERVVLAAPPPGPPRQYSLYAVAGKLHQYPDMANVHLRGPLTLHIERRSRPLDFDRVTAEIEAFVQVDARWAGRAVEVRAEVPDPLPAAGSGAMEVSILDAYALPGSENRHRFILVFEGTDAPAPLKVDATVSELLPVWIAARELPRGHVIGRGDLETRSVVPGREGEAVTACRDITGMEINRQVRTGQVMQPHYVLPPLSARRGDLVDVIAQREGLRVVMRMRALSSGRRGERIFCLNERSGHRVYVRLDDTRKATLDF